METENGLDENLKLILTDRDIEIFRFLNEQMVMVCGQIYEIFWPNSEIRSGTARQRLTGLVDAGYIRILETEIKHKQLTLFLLTQLGLKELQKRNLDHGFSVIKDIGSIAVEHSLKLGDIRGVFRNLGQSGWISERVIRSFKQRTWFPDGILTVNGLHIAIEVENTFKTKDRYVERFKKYELDDEFRLVIYVVSWATTKGWILDIDSPQSKICFADYNERMTKKEKAILENKISEIPLSEFIG